MSLPEAKDTNLRIAAQWIVKLYPSTMFVIIPESTNVYIFDAVSDTNGDDKAYLLWFSV